MQIYTHPLCRIQGLDFPPPENPSRFGEIEELLRGAVCPVVRRRPAAPIVMNLVRRTHSYVEQLRMEGGNTQTIDDEIETPAETYIDMESYETAIAGVATSIAAAENRGFALVRPPGHHAHSTYTHGYCLLNNMAIATKALVERGERVLVFDMDVHHGCGTEDILSMVDNTMFVSFYKAGIWPGEGHYVDARNSVRVPIEGEVDDAVYARHVDRYLVRELQRFKPTVVGVSLGLDTFKGEQFGWRLTEETVRNIKDLLANQPHFGILEGGYEPSSVYYGVRAFAR